MLYKLPKTGCKHFKKINKNISELTDISNKKYNWQKINNKINHEKQFHFCYKICSYIKLKA